MDVKSLINAEKDYLVAIRRKLHRYPEGGLKEFKTSQVIKDELDSFGIEWKTIAGTGVVADIKGTATGEDKIVALRADIDAVKVQELNEFEYKSEHDGYCHACGHDGHMASLLGAAKVLAANKEKFSGTVRLLFQPAEENLEGAKLIIEEGGLEGVGEIFGIHLLPDVPVGLVAVAPGSRMSSSDFFDIEIKGPGGHGGFPHKTIDTVVAASAVVINLQHLVSREVSPMEPLVITVGKINGGSRGNVVPSSVILQGTTRCFSGNIRDELPGKIERVISNTVKSYRAEYSFDYYYKAPPMVNDAVCATRAEKIAMNLYGNEVIYPLDRITGAEDFAFYVQKVPGVFVFVGCSNIAKGIDYPLHSDRYDIDEDALEVSASLYTLYALDFLNPSKNSCEPG
ncbi:MAG: amidohydrolase [Gammaproteobacteria bacterium]|nr:MAG: amidohydrolase [Gammaproteobacteria bacterium]